MGIRRVWVLVVHKEGVAIGFPGDAVVWLAVVGEPGLIPFV